MEYNEASAKAGRGCGGFCGLLTIAFIVLKLCGVIDWAWVWVLAPIWAPVVLVIAIILIITIVGAIVGILKGIFE